jgi:predicted acylesterase/phospholipase RssA
LLEAKDVVNFEDLKDKKHDLKIIASDVTDRSIVVFDRARYPSLKIAQAVRMSIGIPFFFHAYRFGDSLVVDGGLLSNYPLWVFVNSKEPTLGFKLVSKSGGAPPTAPSSFPQYLTSLVSTMLEAHDKEDEKTIDWARTIHIPTYDVVATDFGLSHDKKKQLFDSGYSAASEYIRANGGRVIPRGLTQAQTITRGCPSFS